MSIRALRSLESGMPNSVRRDLLDGLQELRDALHSGERISDKLTVCKVKLNLRPTRYTMSEPPARLACHVHG